MYSALSVANAFIELSLAEGKPLTHLQIQKLVYITQGFHLASKNEPIFSQDIMAWPYGPVTPVLYKKLKKFGRDKVNEPIILREDDKPVDKDSFAYGLIKTIYESYKDYTGSQLSTITHKPNTPWATTWHQLKFSPISHNLIKEHYMELLP